MEIGGELSREAAHWVAENRTGDCPKWVMSTSELEVRLFTARAARLARQLATTGQVLGGQRAATKCGDEWVRETGSRHGMRASVRQAELRRADSQPSDVVRLERQRGLLHNPAQTGTVMVATGLAPSGQGVELVLRAVTPAVSKNGMLTPTRRRTHPRDKATGR